jgi:hypothetical protein
VRLSLRKLHDEGGVFVGLFVQSIELGSVVECLLGNLASLVGEIQELVVAETES